VVASEVRTLAHRSAGAAKEIKELIGNTVQTVESGSRLVDEAGATMLEVVDSVQRVTAIMGEMSNANQEQNEGIERINRPSWSLTSRRSRTRRWWRRMLRRQMRWRRRRSI
jgi:methyl-accepting chemotaxis protein